MQAKSSLPGSPAEKRILIVDDHSLLRRGLSDLIATEPGLTICGQAATYMACLEAVDSSRPDLVIVDLSLSDGDALAMMREIRAHHERLPILVLTLHDGPVWARRALRAGASGYVTKQELGEALLVGIRRVLGGEVYVSPRVKARLDPT